MLKTRHVSCLNHSTEVGNGRITEAGGKYFRSAGLSLVDPSVHTLTVPPDPSFPHCRFHSGGSSVAGNVGIPTFVPLFT